RHNTNFPLLDGLHPKWGLRPTNVDVTRHHLVKRRRGSPYCRWSRLKPELFDEVEHIVPAGWIARPISDGLAIDVLDRLDWRIRLIIRIIAVTGRTRPDHPHRGAFGVGAQHSDRANAPSHIGVARRNGRFDLPISSIDHVEVDSVLREDAGRLAELRWRRLPSPALGGGELEQVRRRRLRRCRRQRGNHRGHADDNVYISGPLHRGSRTPLKSWHMSLEVVTASRPPGDASACGALIARMDRVIPSVH